MRNRLKITKPDETGFSKSVSVSKRPPLPTLDEDALDALRIKPADAVKTDSPEAQPAPAPASATSEEVQAAPEPVPSADSTSKKSPSKPEASSTKGKSQTPRTTEDERVELVLPPRARRANDKMTVHLRLRVLERHVEGLRALEERGYHRRSVLQAALNNMPRLNRLRTRNACGSRCRMPGYSRTRASQSSDCPIWPRQKDRNSVPRI